MSRRAETIAPDWFEALYAEQGDPWNFAGSAYEQAKYRDTLAALPRTFHPEALEVGCSIGVLTALLAPRCGRLLALDAAETCLNQARQRCAGLANVAFTRAFVPGEWPDGAFDLIVLSEVIYYLDAGDVARLARRVEAALRPGGVVALAHWTGLTDYPLSGDEAVAIFAASLPGDIASLTAERRPEYRLDIFARAE